MNVLILIALAYFASVLILAQWRAPAEYSPRRHTISQLASQGYPRKRLMQAGFLIYGAMFTLALATIMLDSPAPIVRDLPHLVYGLALAPTGVFCSIPFLRGKRFSRREARIHAISAQVSGAAFGLGIAVHALLATGGAVLTFHLVSLLVYAAGAVWFVRTRRRMGMAQRLMYAYGSVWLLATYGTGVFL
jgi:hypothetical protein